MFWPFGSAVLHRFLEFPGGPERDLLAGLDFDGLAGCRVPSHPGCPLPYLKDTETGEADFVPFFRWRVVSVTKSPSTASACLFANLMAVGQLGGEVLQGDGCLGGRLCWGGGFLGCGGSLLRWRQDDLPGRFAAGQPAHTARACGAIPPAIVSPHGPVNHDPSCR